jgi:hypothetical protein
MDKSEGRNRCGGCGKEFSSPNELREHEKSCKNQKKS